MEVHAREMCGYCSDHGELMESRKNPQISRKRAKSLSSARFTAVDEKDENVSDDGGDILCLMGDNGSYMRECNTIHCSHVSLFLITRSPRSLSA